METREGTTVLDFHNYNEQKTSTLTCNNCGAELDQNAAFCTNCGAETGFRIVHGTIAPQELQGTQMVHVQQQQNKQVNTITDFDRSSISKREFINQYASPAYKKSIVGACIAFYICAGVTTIISLITDPIGIIDALLLAGLALGLHLSKKQVFAILLLILTVLEGVIGSIVSESVTGYVWVAVSISVLVTFGKINKEYKKFKNQ